MSPQNTSRPQARPTEIVARETLEGLIHELASLSVSDHHHPWERISRIGAEIEHVGRTVAYQLKLRQSAAVIVGVL